MLRAQAKRGNICVDNNVSSFAWTFKITRMRDRKARGVHRVQTPRELGVCTLVVQVEK